MPLLIIAFALGIIVLQQMPVLPGAESLIAIFLAAFLLAGMAALFRDRCWVRRLLLVAMSLLLGFSWAAWRADQRLASSLPADWEGRDVELIGVVAEMPQAFARGERFVFETEQVLTPGAVLPGRLMLSWYRSGEDQQTEGLRMVPGERWKMSVRLKRPHGNANPGGFDYEAWLLERNIRATGYVRPQPVPERLAESGSGFFLQVERWRHEIRSRFMRVLGQADYAGVLVALAVGDQQAIQGEFWRVFAATGTTHLMSISGLHVTMVAALLGVLAGFLWRRSIWLMQRMPAQRAAIVVGWAGALGYVFLSGFSVPAQRTLYMVSVVALSMLCGRRVSITQTLSLALLLVLLIDPWAVLAPGFWLSFGAVAVLFYVSSGRFHAVTGWRATLRNWGVSQWAVTLASAPLLLLFFQQFSLVSPLANALAIPVVSLIVTPLVLIAIVLPWPALLHLAHGLLALLMQFLVFLADAPLYQHPAPPLLATILALAGVMLLLLPRGFPARWLGLCLMLPAWFYTPLRPAPGSAEVVVLDVGQGLAVVVHTATKTLVYDTGPLYSAESDAGQRIVLPYLRARGEKKIDTLIVTHSDSDHSGGAASIMAALPVERIISSIDSLSGEACVAGQEWEFDGVRFSMLHPGAEPHAFAQRMLPNHLSCVLRIASAQGASILLTSDIEVADEKAMLERDTEKLASDVLLVPHHGSRTSSSPAFITAVGAEHVVYPVGYRNRFGHPRADVVARYAGATAWRTDQEGAIRITLDEKPRIMAERRLNPRYWYGR